MVHVSAERHHAERRAGKGTPTSGQSPGGGRHSPPQAGGRKDPEFGGRPSRPGPPRSALSGRLGGTRLSLRFAQRCRPEVGVPWRPAPSGPVGFPRGAAFSQQLAAFPGERVAPWDEDSAERGTIPVFGDTRLRPPAGRSAGPHRETGQRSAFPCLRAVMPTEDRRSLPGPGRISRSRRRRCFPAPRRGCRASGGRP